MEVSLESMEALRFGDYLGAVPQPAMLAVFKGEEWDNYGLLLADSALIYSVVAVLLGSTAFDSFTNTSWWLRTIQSSDVSSVVWATGGLLVMIAIVLVTFTAAAAWMARYGTGPHGARRPGTYARAMAGSLVPIVVGYAVAHYFTLLVVEGQRVAVNLSDPLGRGWDLLGTAGWQVDSSIVDHPTAIALVQLLAIVAGHVLGAVAAHEKAVTLLPPDRALRGQWPMLVLMVGYTTAGLVLLFSP